MRTSLDERCAGNKPEEASDAELIPLVKDLRASVQHLRRELDGAFLELRAIIEGKRKAYVTIEELASLTGRAPYTVRTWVKQGRVRALRVSGTGPKGRLLISRDEVEKLIKTGLSSQIPPIVVD